MTWGMIALLLGTALADQLVTPASGLHGEELLWDALARGVGAVGPAGIMAAVLYALHLKWGQKPALASCAFTQMDHDNGHASLSAIGRMEEDHRALVQMVHGVVESQRGLSEQMARVATVLERIEYRLKV